MDKKTEDRIRQLREVKAAALKGGGERKIETQHRKGRMTARERLDYLLDDGSFTEFNMLLCHMDGAPGDGLVSGVGTINGKKVCVYSQDPTVKGGSIGALHGYKMYRTVEQALQMGIPLVGLHDSPGARLPKIKESKTALGDMMEKSGGSIFYPNTQASGAIPQISAILGSCAGISVYSPALTDFIFMVDKTSHMYITGPDVIKAVTGEDIDFEGLGGAAVHNSKSGNAHFMVSSDEDAMKLVRALISYIPQNNMEEPPCVEGDYDLTMPESVYEVVPTEPKKGYDVREVIKMVVDDGSFLEVHASFAQCVVVGFGRIAGRSVGIVANQPAVLAGALDIDSSDKAARFIRFLDAFNIPIITFVDTPGYLPGVAQEHGGIIRHGAKLLFAYSEATVPKIIDQAANWLLFPFHEHYCFALTTTCPINHPAVFLYHALLNQF